MSYADLLITLTANESDESNVTIAFLMGVKALDKGHSVEILLLANGIHLAERGYASKIDVGEPFKPTDEMLAAFIEKGGTIKVCSSCMEHNGVTKEDLIEEAAVITADYVIDAVMNSEKSLQLN